MKISEGITRFIGQQSLTMKKNSPHILFALGIAGVVGGTVMACRATLKADKTIDEVRHDVMTVKAKKTDALIESDETYTNEKYYKDMLRVYGKSSLAVVKLYGPAVIVSTAGIALLAGSHAQLARRNSALSVTLAGVMEAFDAYRERVREEIGAEKELDLYRGFVNETIEIDGKKELVKVKKGAGSIHSRFFDESSIHWANSAEYNRLFLQIAQNYFNHQLNAYGHVFLNDVYDHLGLDTSQAGQLVGWLRNGNGDGYIDFGLDEAFDPRRTNRYEKNFHLDFNVDNGTIFDKVWNCT